MNYTLTLLTTAGEISGVVTSPTISSEAPFGLHTYRGACSSTLSVAEQSAFWDLVDQVLSQNSLSSAEFIRAIRATTGTTTVGIL
jgi:hypothetical protein